MPAPLNLAQSRPMAFLSDVHGNLPALDAVLAELARRAITDIYVAGDHLIGGDQPLEVWMRLMAVQAKLGRGPGDMALGSVDPRKLSAKTELDRIMLDRFVQTREALGEFVLARLRKLPEQQRIPLIDGSEIVVVHGSPAHPTIDMSHEMEDHEIIALVGDDPADLVIVGGSHVPFDRVFDTLRVVDVGSVGASPDGNFAHFTVVSPRVDGTDVEQTWAEY